MLNVSISERFMPAALKLSYKLAYSIPNILKNYKKIIKKGKDQLDFLSYQDVVYKISCDDCEASYVGQTKRRLKTRLQEHMSDIRKKKRDFPRSLRNTELVATTILIGIMYEF